MTVRQKLSVNIILIFLLAFFAGSLVYPKYFNQGADFLNSKLNFKIPYFWEKPFSLGLDLQGGVHLLYQADLSNIPAGDKDDAMSGLRDVIERRVNLFGVSEPVVQVQGEKLVVELAGVFDISDAIKMIGETPFLEFKEYKDDYETIIDKNKKIIESGSGEQFEDPFRPTALTGKYLKRADVDFNQTTGEPLVSLQFNDEGVKIFAEITKRNINKPLAIYLDGASIVDTDADGKITDNDIYAPIVQEEITGGNAQISGSMDAKKAREIVRRLNSGALPVSITIISQQAVGPSLGRTSLAQSLKAWLFGFIAVILFIMFFYRLPGILASLALGIYIIFILAIFKLIAVTLTLAGIGGFILSIGMAVDANILIFSRIKEELKTGKNFKISLQEGFKRAWPSVRDGNLTTLLVALILFLLGASFIKGFALTLSIGIIISMFSAIVITKNFLRVFEGTKLANIKWLWG